MTDSTALGGLKVIEIAQGWAGPIAAVILADFGAEVLKVESIQHPDWWRGSAAGVDDGFTHERSWFYNGINRNKSGLTLDLSSERGRNLLLGLIRDADVFIENFTSHVVKALRLTHEELATVNSRIISVSMPAYGSDTSWADLPALGTTVESMCGVQGLTGYEGGPPRIQGTSWDPVVGLHATFAIFAALHRRETTGVGEHIEVSHIEAGTQSVAPAILEYAITGQVPRRMGNASRTCAPHGCYKTDGDEQWLTIVARADREWTALLQVLDSEELRDLRFATLLGRLDNRHDLDGAIERATSTRNRDQLFRALQAAGVPAAPVMSPADLLADPHLGSRGFFVPFDRAFVGTHLYPGEWIHLESTPPVFHSPAPTLGQHNREVLGGVLGLDDEELARLEADGIIGTRPAGR